MATSSFKQTSREDDRRSWPQRREIPRFSMRSIASEVPPNYVGDLEIIKHLKKKRSRALASLTRKKNQIEPILLNHDDVENLDLVDSKMGEYCTIFDKFCEANDAYDNVLQDGQARTESFMYFVEVKKNYLEFCQKVSEWASSMEKQLQNTPEPGDKQPTQSISSISSSLTSRASLKSTIKSRIAELEARQESIQRRKELHEKEARLKEEKLKLDFERESLEVEEELRSLKAKEDLKSVKEEEQRKAAKAKEGKRNLKFGGQDKEQLKDLKFGGQLDQPNVKEEPKTAKVKEESQSSKSYEERLMPPDFFSNTHPNSMMDQQRSFWNHIMLQQQRTSLPRQQVPKFNGDPLEYHNFLRAFDTLIASKEPDHSCKLYYLEQYTVGRPQELVRSCLHMKPGDGYLKARDLLEQRFGDKYKIAMAHVDKLLSIQPIKPMKPIKPECRFSREVLDIANKLQERTRRNWIPQQN